MSRTIYKVLTREQWAAAQAGGPVQAPVDVADGYVHFSTAEQLQATLSKWFKGQSGCVLVAFEADEFGDLLKWEPAREGDLFPHVYGRVSASKARSVLQLAMGEDDAPLAPPNLPREGLS